mmetsp:Transcript_33511/g.82233  ORF Transcript_33511/g.82233 Transcript_33511/m.82233 type:complete len:253 (+) Transcript_33511:661-1419(+)
MALMPDHCCTTWMNRPSASGHHMPPKIFSGLLDGGSVASASAFACVLLISATVLSTRCARCAPYRRRSARRAASSRPLSTSQRGDSMRHTVSDSAACASAGTAPRPNMKRQPNDTSLNARPTTYDTRMPTVMNSWLSVPTAPRTDGGDISVMMSGTTMLSRPMPTPSSTRMAMSMATCTEPAQPSAPSTSGTSAASSTGRRPKRLASGAAMSAPTSALPMRPLTLRPTRMGWSLRFHSALSGSMAGDTITVS